MYDDSQQVREQRLLPATRILAAICYLVPLIVLVDFALLWLLYVGFVVAVLISRPKAYYLRFHFMQSLICSVAFLILTVLVILLGSGFLHNPPVLGLVGFLAFLVFIAYIIVSASMVLSILLSKTWRVPFIGDIADKYAKRTIA